METEKSTFGKANKHHKQPEFPPTLAELAICYCSSILVLASRQFWQKLNLEVGPKIFIATILVDLNLALAQYRIAVHSRWQRWGTKKTQLYFCVAPRNNSNFVRINHNCKASKLMPILPRSRRDGAFLLYIQRTCKCTPPTTPQTQSNSYITYIYHLTLIRLSITCLSGVSLDTMSISCVKW